MSKGAIWLHRQLLDCAEVADPFALAVWVHLLLRASHKPCRLMFRGKTFAVERGQLVTSLRQLEADTKVPLQRLRTILNRFAVADMAKINTAGNTAATVVTICKYEEYQALTAATNTAINSLPTQSQHSANTQNKNGRMEEGDSESESPTVSHGLPSPPAKAVRKAVGYSPEFEKLWLTYPRREEDDKAGCWKLYSAAVRDHDAAAIQASAEAWHREQRDNEFRIGLRRWLKDRRYLTPPPIHRPNGSPKADPFFAAAHDFLNPQDQNHEPDDFGTVLEGTCDREPHEASGGGSLVDTLGGGGPAVAGSLRGRVAALPAAGSDGWLRAVGAAEGDLARPGRVDRVHHEQFTPLERLAVAGRA